MSPRLPVLQANELIHLLETHGFERVGQKGSHVKMRSQDGVTIIVPVHAGRNIKPGLLLAILNKAGIDISDLRR